MFINLNGYVSHCGNNRWEELMEKRGVIDYTSLAKTACSSISINVHISYFLQKCKKANSENEICLLISNNTKFLKLCWALLYSRYQNVWIIKKSRAIVGPAFSVRLSHHPSWMWSRPKLYRYELAAFVIHTYIVTSFILTQSSMSSDLIK